MSICVDEVQSLRFYPTRLQLRFGIYLLSFQPSSLHIQRRFRSVSLLLHRGFVWLESTKGSRITYFCLHLNQRWCNVWKPALAPFNTTIDWEYCNLIHFQVYFNSIALGNIILHSTMFLTNGTQCMLT